MKFWKKKDKSKSTNPFEQDMSDSKDYSPPPLQPESTQESRYKSAPLNRRDHSQDRNNLFSGCSDPANRYDTNGQEDLYSKCRLAEDDDDQEVVQIQGQIRDIKQDSLASTRNALQKITEAESAAANTMNMLGTQSTQIANIDRNLDLSKGYSDKASSQASELKRLNRSIFIPNINNPFTKSAKEIEAVERLQRGHTEHMAERDQIRQFEYGSNARIEDVTRKAKRVSRDHRGRSQADRNKYQFEADKEDDAIEDEIDTNLGLLGDASARLKAMATGMNEELDSQNKQLKKTDKKVDPINAKLMSTTYTLDSTK